MESATCCGMESAQGAGWNHGNAVYGIKPQELYSIRASRNAMRDFVGVPYNARSTLIPYQACGLDNKKRTFVTRQKCVFCWRRKRDLNSRYAFYTYYSLSRGAPSASWVFLHWSVCCTIVLRYNSIKKTISKAFG